MRRYDDTLPSTSAARTEPEPQGVASRLLHAARAQSGEHVTLSGILGASGGAAAGYLILLCALPASIPTVPGLASIFGVPLLLLGLQMLAARPSSLPPVVASRKLHKKSLLRTLQLASRLLHPLEQRLRPRWAFATGPQAMRWLGALVAALGVTVALPLPLTNIAPAAGAALIGLGLCARDGQVVLLGVIAGLVGLLIAGSAIYALAALPLLHLGA